MRMFLAALAAMGILASTADIGLGQGRSAAAPSIEGVWLGTTTVTTGANASTNPKRLPNIQIYTKGHYVSLTQDGAVQRPPRQAPAAPRDPAKLTDAEKIARYELWAPVGAHGGTYEVKGNILIQHQTVAKGLPTVATFEFRLEDGGNRWIHIAKSAPGQPVSETRRTYTRLE